MKRGHQQAEHWLLIYIWRTVCLSVSPSTQPYSTHVWVASTPRIYIWNILYIMWYFTAERLQNFKVVLSDISPPVPYGRQLDSDPYRLCVQYWNNPPARPTTLPCLPTAIGRYIYIFLPRAGYLTVCEFEAYGTGKYLCNVFVLICF